MTHKNPFEIRAEMLHLAKDYMDTQQQMNIQFANDMYEQGKKNMQDVQEAYKMYSMDDVINEVVDRMATVNYEFEVPELGVSIDDIQYHFNQWLRSIGYVIEYDDR